jgi:hypothetical protein
MSLDQRIVLFMYEERHQEKFKDQLLNFQLPPEQAKFTGLQYGLASEPVAPSAHE